MRRFAVAATVLLACSGAAQAASEVKLGIMTQLSGPISPSGTEIKRGMDVALEELGNKLGGLPVRLTVVDDKSNPAEAVQGASKLIDEAQVDFVTGLGASNTLIPVFKTFADAGVFLVGALAGPLQFAGKECHKNGFFVSFTNDDWPAASGKYMNDRGFKSAFFLAADYQAGKEHVAAAMQYFNGKKLGPIYTPLTQLDFSAEIARIRAEKPDAIYTFLVGAGGIAFVKQYAQAGLQTQIPHVSEDPVGNPLTFPAQGDAVNGLIVSTNWNVALDNPANKRFVAAFQKKYNRLPATFAALSYDAIKLIDAAVRDVGGKIEDKDAVRAALRKANFESVRGKFKFNNNHYPIQDLYIVQIEKDAKGQMQSVLKGVAIKDWKDPHAPQCPMKW